MANQSFEDDVRLEGQKIPDHEILVTNPDTEKIKSWWDKWK
ncbi:hypothetical Protein YC6258_00498 [Gynuella sunshinyii YC6258]|uniref:Uncharacterized protein n=1 Tax=Gynuella sunshinyii YC6258 TaxID=1445510 RepID=A0A0C5VGM7_9GAMM|nr:hypothetical Protein YC6258_00498 [Gynuella sunshinyii YC6258]